MSSHSFLKHLQVVLNDAEDIAAAHKELRSGKPGRQYGLGTLNRAVVVMCVSAWEAYVEKVLAESLDLLRSSSGPLGVWPALNASVRSQIGRFNNPNVHKTRDLFYE